MSARHTVEHGTCSCRRVTDLYYHEATDEYLCEECLDNATHRRDQMAEEKMSLIEELQNPPRVEGGGLDEDKAIDLMRTAADALSTMIGVAAGLAAAPRR
jgi:hypothetical protein